MTNKGIVTEVNGEMLTIVFERHEACGDCHACHHGSENCKKHTITIRGKAEIGDEIVVAMDESHVMAASAMAYMIPFAGFMLGFFLGWLVAPKLGGWNSEFVMALFAVLGTALAYVVMRLLDPIFSKDRWEPRIVSVTKPTT